MGEFATLSGWAGRFKHRVRGAWPHQGSGSPDSKKPAADATGCKP